MPLEKITVYKADYIGHLVLNQPEITENFKQTFQELRELIEMLEEDEEVRVVIFKGLGQKLNDDIMSISNSTALIRDSWQALNPVSLITDFRKPTVAVIECKLIGRDLDVALACDIRISAQEIDYSFTEANNGTITGSGIIQRITRLVGIGKALELILTGKTINGIEAEEIGLITKAVPREELDKTVLETARSIASKAPIALKYAKEAIVRGIDLPFESGLRLETDLSMLLQTTEDRKEGLRSFREKRTPQFKGN